MSCKSLPISCARIVCGRLRGTCSVVITACVTEEGCHGMCYFLGAVSVEHMLSFQVVLRLC